MIDFEFDGERLSEYNCIIGNVVTGFNDSHQMFSTMNLNTINSKDVNQIVSIDYSSSVLSKTFDIVKNNCMDANDIYFTDSELNKLIFWLNKKEYKYFKPLYDNYNFSDVHYYGLFNDIKCLTINSKIVGLSLTFTSNAPYGFGDKISCKNNITSNNNTILIQNDSHDIGYLYFDKFIIKCKSNGEINITNTSDSLNRKTIIKNCVNNEVLTLDCKNKIITSSVSHQTLYNDFNYKFPRLYKNDENYYNIFNIDTSKISNCEIEYSFEPIRKVGVIV